MIQADYAALLRHLASPEETTLTPAALEEALCRHEPPDDPRWPAPRLFIETRLMLRRLPHRQQVLCALTAAELALPLWDRWAADRPAGPALRPALACGHAWLAGRSTVAELNHHLTDAVAASEKAARAAATRTGPASATAYVARLAADATDNALYTAAGTNSENRAVVADRTLQAVANGARAWAHYRRARGLKYGVACAHFLQRWWSRCRCRLAIRDVDRASLSW